MSILNIPNLFFFPTKRSEVKRKCHTSKGGAANGYSDLSCPIVIDIKKNAAYKNVAG